MGEDEEEGCWGEDEEILKAIKSSFDFQKNIDGMGSFEDVLKLYTGTATTEKLSSMHPGAKKIVNDYDPDKKMTDFEKIASETGLFAVQLYLRSVVQSRGEEKSKKHFLNADGSFNEDGENYFLVMQTPIENMREEKSGAEIKTSLAQAVDMAYRLLQQG